jgi:hypothetical protein
MPSRDVGLRPDLRDSGSEDVVIGIVFLVFSAAYAAFVIKHRFAVHAGVALNRVDMRRCVCSEHLVRSVRDIVVILASICEPPFWARALVAMIAVHVGALESRKFMFHASYMSETTMSRGMMLAGTSACASRPARAATIRFSRRRSA